MKARATPAQAAGPGDAAVTPGPDDGSRRGGPALEAMYGLIL